MGKEKEWMDMRKSLKKEIGGFLQYVEENGPQNAYMEGYVDGLKFALQMIEATKRVTV